MVPDVMPKLLTELRDDPDVAAIVGTRVRGYEPAQGDAQPLGSYRAFIVLVTLDAPIPSPRAPIQRAVIGVRCYGRTPQEAAQLRWEAHRALHLKGGRTFANGLHIYQSLDESGGGQEKDPDTGQPYQEFIVSAHATTVAVA